MNSNQVKGFLAGIIAAVCYGTNPLGTLELYHDGFSSGSVLTYRYLLAVVMFAIVLLYAVKVSPSSGVMPSVWHA